MRSRGTRAVDTTKMPTIAEGTVFDNHYPCLCNGKTDIINEDWNGKGWNVEFHIPDSGDRDRDAEAAELLKLINDDTIAITFIIREDVNVVAKGSVVYGVKDGQIQKFECDGGEQSDAIKDFIEHLIVYFGKINYVERMNAANKLQVKKHNTNFDNPNAEKIYDFQSAENQPAYVPKRTTISRNSRHRNGYKVRKIVYKKEVWEKSGYYRRNGAYVKPCSCRRHLTV